MPLISCKLISQQYSGGASVVNSYRQHLGVIARHSAGFDRLHQPFRNQAFGKLTLRVVKTENREVFSCVQQTLKFVLLGAASIHSTGGVSHSPIEP